VRGNTHVNHRFTFSQAACPQQCGVLLIFIVEQVRTLSISSSGCPSGISAAFNLSPLMNNIDGVCHTLIVVIEGAAADFAGADTCHGGSVANMLTVCKKSITVRILRIADRYGASMALLVTIIGALSDLTPIDFRHHQVHRFHNTFPLQICFKKIVTGDMSCFMPHPRVIPANKLEN
jgi:hypothetical protein